MEPMYIYATPAQVKKWQKEQEKIANERKSEKINPTSIEHGIKAYRPYEKQLK